MHDYTAYHFTVTPLQPGVDILIAELGQLGFDSFVENEDGLSAYILSNDNHPNLLDEVQILQSPEFSISYTTAKIETVNWNAEWEKNFSPIQVANLCTVRAPFHEKAHTKYEIIIEPKMSFGTGHHATTYMMIQLILEEDWKSKSVLDMGCGTGVLAILTEMKGATKIDAIDIDNWCYENSLENVQKNKCQNISVFEGSANLLKGKSYQVIIANINRNILLNDIEQYANSLEANGNLFLSGFYEKDLPIIQQACENYGLQYSKHLVREEWVAVKFVKS